MREKIKSKIFPASYKGCFKNSDLLIKILNYGVWHLFAVEVKTACLYNLYQQRQLLTSVTFALNRDLDSFQIFGTLFYLILYIFSIETY